jgi:hypothetical protein
LKSQQTFNFLSEKCQPKLGEESFHILIIGYYKCENDKYRFVHWTVGPGYYYANKTSSYITGVKIGKKDFYGIGVRAQVGIKFGIGINVYVGNGLILALDVEDASGVYAGVSYLNIRPK